MKSLKMSGVRIAAFVWAAIPVAMMIAFWFRPVIAVPVLVLFLAGSVVSVRRLGNEDSGRIELNRETVAVVAMIPLWMLVVGIGGFIGQETCDNAFRNAVLEELTLKSWPVVSSEYRPFAYLSYYFSFWLPAAAVGKMAGGSYELSQVALFLYCYVGLTALALLVMHHCRRRSLLVGVMLFVFCTPDIINYVVFSESGLGWHSNRYVGSAVFGAPTLWYLCTFIYNQGISAWLLLMLMLEERENRGMQLLLFSMLFTLAPFPAVVVAPLLGVMFLRNLRRMFTVANVGGFLTCVLLAVFYCGNTSGTSLQTIFDDKDYTPLRIVVLTVCYLLFNYGLFFPFIRHKVRHDVLFWGLFASTAAVSIVMPAYGNNDFGWKAPMAFTGYFLLKLLEYVAGMEWSLRSVRCRVLALLLVVGAMSNFNIWYSEVWRWHCLLKGADTEYARVRADRFSRQLFNPEATKKCYGNFVTDRETVYSRYFMPGD